MKAAKILRETLNPKLLNAEYAVRGAILIQANKFDAQLKQGEKFPFDEITFCNIGNPQRLNQKPMSFLRNVLALTNSPDLLYSEHANKIFAEDEIARAKKYVESTPGILGAYTHSQGLDVIRHEVADFIAERDQTEKPNIDNIFLTDGASTGIQNVMFSLIRGEKDGIMTPIPQYPLYSASITLFGGSLLPYYLTEEQDWAITFEEFKKSFEMGKEQGIECRAAVVINPGNPTGNVLQVEDMKDIIQFCYDNGIVLLADEVYQENIYDEDTEWLSFRKVALSMGEEIKKDFQLVSFHSVSKGFLGECGRRGGYMEFSEGFEPEVVGELYKRASINLCPNVDGQVVCGCMVNPPKEGEPSFEQWETEKNAILDSLTRRAKKLSTTLDTLPGMSCNLTTGAMYAFPQVMLPEGAVKEAEENGMVPDLFYCLELLKATGICVVPGSGFGQVDGTFHFRTTFLPEESKMDGVIERMANFQKEFMSRY